MQHLLCSPKNSEGRNIQPNENEKKRLDCRIPDTGNDNNYRITSQCKGIRQREDNPRNKYSWEQTKEEPSQTEQENNEQEGSVDESVSEEEAAVEEATTPVEEETPVYLEGNLTGSDETYSATVTFNTDAQIPEGSAVTVKELTENDEAYQNAKEQVQPEDGDSQFTALDISIVDAEGNEIEPMSEVQVELQVSKLPEGVDGNTEIIVNHIDESTGSPVAEAVADTADTTEGTVEVSESSAVVKLYCR